MFIATLAFVTYVKVVVLRILYTPACREIRAAWGKMLNPSSDQRSLEPSGDSESFVLFESSRALRRLSIKQSLGQDIPRSFGESGSSSGA